MPVYKGHITLVNVNDGEKGQQGKTYYTWIKYADDENGSNMTNDPTGKEYIGLAYNKEVSVESNNPADYSWALFKGSDGIDGTDGKDGKDGQDGKDGESSYVHIKYSNDGLTFSDNLVTTDIEDWKSGGLSSWSSSLNNNIGTDITKLAYLKSINVTQIPIVYINTKSTSVSVFVVCYDINNKYISNNIFYNFPKYLTFPQGTASIRIELRGLSSYEQYKQLFESQELIPSLVDPENFGNIPGDWLGSYISLEEEASIDFSVYNWTKIKGQDGQDGSSASLYRIEANQKEILKFVSLDGNTITFSPENLQFVVYKDQAAPGSAIHYEQVRGLSKEKFSVSVYDINSNQYIDISPDFINFDETQDTFNIDLYNLSRDALAFRILLDEECLVRYTYLLENEEGNFNLIDYLNVRYGIKKDMAALSVEAGKIVQSIQDTYLEFTPTGLILRNGGLIVQDKWGNEVIRQSPEGNITVTGTINANSGYFAGELRSKSGYFEGSITAKSGKIGGFNISEDKLTSEKTYIKITDEQETYLPNITLDGTTGQIIAHDIILGAGAVIEDYIKIGNAFIYNPTNHRDKFIEAGNINLNQTGILNLGSIEMHGGDNTTQAYMRSKNNNWQIYENGTAIFNDIYADNVHLQDTILEIGTVQAMGSLMLFKDSWSITSANNNIIVVNGLTNLNVNDWIYSGNNIYKVTDIKQDTTTTATTTTITLNKSYILDDGLIITKFGKTSNSQVPGFILSILGEQATTNDNRAFASGNALTISDFVEENGALTYTKRLVLGQLDGAVDKNITGLGLYADNVFLNGSLTTKVDDDSYAGINTIGEATATKFGDKDKSRIIFWAGSASNSNIDIQEAPFQVTENGSIYAGKGIFRDSIISDSVIQGADIYAARIHGGTTEQPSSLTIYDTSLGIIFKEGFQSTEKEVFAIRADGLQQNNDYFIEIKNNKIGFYGDSFIIDTRENNYLEIASNTINGVDLTMKIISDGLSSERSYQNFTNDKISFGFNQGSGREETIMISKDKTQLKSLAIWLEKDVYFGSGTSYMQYKKTEEGYDLFINE